MCGVALGSFDRLHEFLYATNRFRLLQTTLRQVLLGTGAIVLFQYLLRLEISRSFILLFLFFDLSLLAAFRWFSPRLVSNFQREFGALYHVLLVGPEERTQELENIVCLNTPFRIEVTARLRESQCDQELPELLNQSIVDEVIFAVDSAALGPLENIFLLCDEQGRSNAYRHELLSACQQRNYP